MKIARLETFAKRAVGFVRVTADSGEQGWGQLSTYHADITAQVFHRQVAPHALGADALDFDDLLDVVTEREHKFPGFLPAPGPGGSRHGVVGSQGQAGGKTRHGTDRGARPGPLRAYASSMKRDITPADEADRLCRLRDEKGFDAFKFRVGAECGRDVDEWPGRTEEIVPTVCRALGDGIAKLVDANSGFSPRARHQRGAHAGKTRA